jgi:hypothetical protein
VDAASLQIFRDTGLIKYFQENLANKDIQLIRKSFPMRPDLSMGEEKFSDNMQLGNTISMAILSISVLKPFNHHSSRERFFSMI